MAYPHKWSPISYKSSAGQRKHIGQRPMLYRWTTQPIRQPKSNGMVALSVWKTYDDWFTFTYLRWPV